MAEDTRSTKDRFVEESIGMIKDSLRVNRDTKGFGNIMKQTFSPANFFGADSKMGKMFSSTDERDRIRGFDSKTQKGPTTASQQVPPELNQIQADVAAIKAIQQESQSSESDPEFRELDKSGKDQLSVSQKILATLQNQEPAMTKVQGDSVIALLKKGVGSGGGGGGDESDSDSGPGFLSGALATGVMMKGKDLFAAGKNKVGSLMQGAKSAGGSLLKGAGGVARGLGGPGLGVGLGAYEAVSGAMGAESELEGLEISAEEAQSRKGESIGSGVGGASGAIAGGVAGAAIGSAVPIIGTFIGGIVGGSIGYFAGSAAGGAAGEAIADAIPVSEEDLNESNQLANDYLDSISEKEGGSELVTKIKAEATEIESKMMEATGKQPEELSENDIEAIANAALIKAIQNNEEEALTIAGYSASEQQNMMDALEDTASGSAGGPKVGDVVSMEEIRALSNTPGGIGWTPAVDEDGDDIPGQYKITRLGDGKSSKRGLEIPDGPVSRGGITVDLEDGGEATVSTPEEIEELVSQGKLSMNDAEDYHTELDLKTKTAGLAPGESRNISGTPTMRKSEKRSGQLVYANMSREQQKIFDEAVMERSRQYREEFKKENEGKEKDSFYSQRLDAQHQRASRDVMMETLNSGGVLGDKEALIEQGVIKGDFATGNADRSYEIEGKPVSKEEYDARLEELDRDGDVDTVVADAIRPNPGYIEPTNAELDAAYDAGKRGVGSPNEQLTSTEKIRARVQRGEITPQQGLAEVQALNTDPSSPEYRERAASDKAILRERGESAQDGDDRLNAYMQDHERRAEFYEDMSENPLATPDQVTRFRQTARELREKAEINEGLSGNTNASVVENATDDANSATAPGANEPIVVQAPAPAPQPQPDINVVVAMPKTIGPETRSGIRMIGMLGDL